LTKAKILSDFVDIDWDTGTLILDDGDTKAVEPGTVVSVDSTESDGTIWYLHPDNGEQWASPPGLYELLKDEEELN
jgi:hypothetical protein